MKQHEEERQIHLILKLFCVPDFRWFLGSQIFVERDLLKEHMSMTRIFVEKIFMLVALIRDYMIITAAA